MNRKAIGNELAKLCGEAAHEHKGHGKKHTREALVVLGRAVAAQGAHMSESWTDTFANLMRGGHLHDGGKGRKVH